MKKLFVVMSMLLLGAVLIISCASPASTPLPSSSPAQPPTPAAAKTTAAGPVYGGVLRSIEGMAPGTAIGVPAEATGSSGGTMGICLQGLLGEGADGTIFPLLAQSFETSTDPANPSITFKIRKGVKFHDGTDLNAQVAMWNFEQVKANPLNTSITGPWKSFEMIDDYTLKINFTTWQNILPRTFTGMASVLISPTSFEKNGVDWARVNMVGTGAFKQTDYQRDVGLKTVKFDQYWEKGKPYVDGVELNYVADENTRLALFKSGGGDVLGISPMRASDLQSAGYKFVTLQGGVSALVPDSANADSPWSNIKVRQAAEYAIDKESIVNAFGYGYWKAAYQWPEPTSPAYDPSIEGRKYDVAKAKQLLAEAGYPDGFKTKIIAPVSANRDMVVALQAQLNAVGIQTEIEFMEMSKYTQTYTGKWDNALIYVGLYWYPNFNAIANFYFRVPASTNFQSTKRPDNWNDLFTASLASPAPEPKLMQAMSRAIYDDVTIIPINSGTSIWAMPQNVYDVQGTRGGSGFWDPQNSWIGK